jgi:hypothetical protein
VRKSKFLLFVAPLIITTAGCDQTKEALGLSRTRPDEFQVIGRPPLSTPPGYGLRPPVPNEEGQSAPTPQKDAETFLLGAESSSLEEGSDAEKSDTETELLSKAQVEKKDTEIRKKLANTTEKTPSIGEKMVFWKDQKKEQVINPKEENKKYNGTEFPGNPNIPSQAPQSEERH